MTLSRVLRGGMCDTTHCNVLQCTATHCNTLQRAMTHSNTLQHTATHCNTLQHVQHTATHCNTLQYRDAQKTNPRTAPTCMSHAAHTNESCHINAYVFSLVPARSTHKHESCQKYTRVMSHICMSQAWCSVCCGVLQCELQCVAVYVAVCCSAF